jgi:hypothetical protein
MAAATLFAVPETANAQSFWNWSAADYQDQRSARPKRVKIKRKADPAEAVANKSAKPVGPLVISISVAKQRVKVYDSNGLFAEAPVSTGTNSRPTPMGVFSIIQKNRHHVSNLYAASMPYMQRITWSGVAMHTGPLPGYAASHGCVRLPNEFAARLWTWTKMGTRVIVAPDNVTPVDFSHPKLVSRMVPLPTVSAAPAPVPVVAAADATLSKSDRAVSAQQRTADAREAIAGMKGTLSDATHAAPSATNVAEASDEPKRLGIDSAGDTPAASTGDAKAESVIETKSAETTTEKAVETPPRDAASKAQDRLNADDTPATAEVPTKAEDKSVVPKSAEAAPAPVDAKPAAAAQDGAKPGDIAKPADVAAPVATPEPAKPAVVATPRRHNHVAVFISRKDKKLYIRHGYEPVFDTPVEIADADRPLGTHVFTARGDKDDANTLHWSVVSLPLLTRRAEARRAARHGSKPAPAPVQSGVTAPLNASEALDRITIPAEAMEKIASIISPGGSLLISDYGLTGWETGKGTDFIVPLRQ